MSKVIESRQKMPSIEKCHRVKELVNCEAMRLEGAIEEVVRVE